MIQPDPLQEVLRHRHEIGNLAIANFLWGIRVFEPGPLFDLPMKEGHVCFLLYTEIEHQLIHNIRLHQELHSLLGYPPHLIPAEAFTGIDLVAFQEHSIPIYPERE